ncbi:hypothetical protein EJ05DRAFT_497670 [Pseudovirgaria hyperparasitica]|uniref:Uncharacterized protein n=1 Tax=Pseudovirgaria hyperparasitica TaxID=470096 RepID=A0A6A6WIR6_9PEZI|nr:uncharacterized protein EJ05DRAFT_497670 [Pseudovirgaria hyperparasitica]KAF2761111.1 hypothetical protein EJ05DRAFT_497670 [Pseudovirgaria hyperparasitica]
MSIKYERRTIFSSLAALVFVGGALTRLTPRLFETAYREQHQKTAESMKPVYSRLGVSAKIFTEILAYINLGVAGLLVWPRTRKWTAVTAMLYLGEGAYARLRSGRSVAPPLVVIGVLGGVVY